MPLQAADIAKYKAIWGELGETIDEEIHLFTERLLEAVHAPIMDEDGSVDLCLDLVSELVVSDSDMAPSARNR